MTDIAVRGLRVLREHIARAIHLLEQIKSIIEVVCGPEFAGFLGSSTLGVTAAYPILPWVLPPRLDKNPDTSNCQSSKLLQTPARSERKIDQLHLFL